MCAKKCGRQEKRGNVRRSLRLRLRTFISQPSGTEALAVPHPGRDRGGKGASLLHAVVICRGVHALKKLIHVAEGATGHGRSGNLLRFDLYQACRSVGRASNLCRSLSHRHNQPLSLMQELVPAVQCLLLKGDRARGFGMFLSTSTPARSRSTHSRQNPFYSRPLTGQTGAQC